MGNPCSSCVSVRSVSGGRRSGGGGLLSWLRLRPSKGETGESQASDRAVGGRARRRRPRATTPAMRARRSTRALRAQRRQGGRQARRRVHCDLERGGRQARRHSVQRPEQGPGSRKFINSAYAYVASPGASPAFNAARTRNFTAITSPSTGLYCLAPAAGISPTTSPLIVSVDWSTSFGNDLLGLLALVWHRLPGGTVQRPHLPARRRRDPGPERDGRLRCVCALEGAGINYEAHVHASQRNRQQRSPGLSIGLAAAGVGASTGSGTNEDPGEERAKLRHSASGRECTNE